MNSPSQAHRGSTPAVRPVRVIDAILEASDLVKTIKNASLPAQFDSPEDFAVILPTLITATYLHLILSEDEWADIPSEALSQIGSTELKEEWIKRISLLEIPIHQGDLRTEIIEPDTIIDALLNIIPEQDSPEEFQKVAQNAKKLLRDLKNKANEILTGRTSISSFSDAIDRLRGSALHSHDREVKLLSGEEKDGLLGIFSAYSRYLSLPEDQITPEGQRKMEMAQSSIHILQNYWIWKELGQARDSSLTLTVIEPLRNFIEALVTYNLTKIHDMIEELSRNDETSPPTTIFST